MNKRFYIAILALAALFAGCSKVDVATPKEKAVAFQVGSYAPQTKAPEGTASIKDVDGITSFSSKAYLHAEGIPTEQSFFGEGETITYHEGTPATWTPSHDYYWPKSALSYVNFISWVGGTPAVSYTKVDNTWKAAFAWDYTAEGQELAPTENLLWADMAWRYNDNVNPAIYGFNNVEEGVPTLFHHALAQVRFLAKVTKESEAGVEWTVKLGYILVKKVKNKGAFSIQNTDPGAKGTNPWTSVEEGTDLGWIDLSGESTEISKSYLDNPLVLTTTAQEVLGYCSVLPQSAGDKQLLLHFTVETKYGTTRTVEETVTLENISLANDQIPSWDMNTRITYTISINPDTGEIKIIPVETDWVTETEYPINIE